MDSSATSESMNTGQIGAEKALISALDRLANVLHSDDVNYAIKAAELIFISQIRWNDPRVEKAFRAMRHYIEGGFDESTIVYASRIVVEAINRYAARGFAVNA